jgi:hypothetical protein
MPARINGSMKTGVVKIAVMNLTPPTLVNPATRTPLRAVYGEGTGVRF